MNYPADAIRRFSADILCQAGMSQADGETCADCLVTADLRTLADRWGVAFPEPI